MIDIEREQDLARQNFGDYTVLHNMTRIKRDRAVFWSIFFVTLTGLGVWKSGLTLFPCILGIVSLFFLAELATHTYLLHDLKKRYIERIGKERFEAWCTERKRWVKADRRLWR